MADVPPPSPNPLPGPRRGNLPGTLGEDAAGAAAELEHLRQAAAAAASAAAALGRTDDQARHEMLDPGVARRAAEMAEAAYRNHYGGRQPPAPPPAPAPPQSYAPTPPPPRVSSRTPGVPYGAREARELQAEQDRWMAEHQARRLAGAQTPVPPTGAPGPPPPPPPPVPTVPAAVPFQVAQLQQRAAQAAAVAQAAGTPQGQQALAESARAQRAAAQAQERATHEVGMGQRAGMAGVRAGVAASYGSVSGVAGAIGELAGGAAGGPVGAAIGSAVASAAGGLIERLVNEVERTRAVANPNAVGTREMSADLLRATAGGPLGRGDMQAAANSQAQAAYLADMERQARETFGNRTVEAAKNIAFGPAVRPRFASFAGLPQARSTSFEEYSQGMSAQGLGVGPLENQVLNAQMRNMMEQLGNTMKDVADNTDAARNFFPTWGKF